MGFGLGFGWGGGGGWGGFEWGGWCGWCVWFGGVRAEWPVVDAEDPPFQVFQVKGEPEEERAAGPVAEVPATGGNRGETRAPRREEMRGGESLRGRGILGRRYQFRGPRARGGVMGSSLRSLVVWGRFGEAESSVMGILAGLAGWRGRWPRAERFGLW